MTLPWVPQRVPLSPVSRNWLTLYAPPTKKVPIVWIYGMGDGTAGWVQTILRELGGESESLYMVQLKPDSSGGNGHPLKKRPQDCCSAAIQLFAQHWLWFPLNIQKRVGSKPTLFYHPPKFATPHRAAISLKTSLFSS